MNPEQRSVNIPDGRSALFRARSTIAAVASMALLAGACTSGSVSTTTTSTLPPATTASAAPAPTPESTTTTAAPVETTTTVASEAVGSREALLEAMEPALGFSESIFGADISTAPIPEINGSDPVEALRELLLLDFWVYSNAPLDSWADVLALPGSPDWELYLGAFDSLLSRIPHFLPSVDPPYEILEARLATDEEASLVPEAVLSDAGTGATIVAYRTRLAPHLLRNVDRPEIDEAQNGWDDLMQIAVLVPTEIGWRSFWSKSA